MTNIQIRNANVRDCELVVRFLRAALQDMEAAGGHAVNSDETFWRDFTAKVSRTIQHNEQLYLLAQTGNVVVGYLEGKSNALHEVFAPKRSFHLNVIYVVPGLPGLRPRDYPGTIASIVTLDVNHVMRYYAT